jgi:hypothetical protein
VTRLWAGQSTVRILAGARDFPLPQSVETSFRPTHAVSTRALCLVLKQPRCDGDSSPPSSAGVKNEWSYTSLPPACLHCVHRDSFAFLC